MIVPNAVQPEPLGRARPFRRSLVVNLILVVLLLGGSLFAVAELTLQRVLVKSSSALAEQIISRLESDLHGLFMPVGATLRLTLAAARAQTIENPTLDQIEFFLEALMRTLPQVTSAHLARENGDSFMLLHLDGEWRSRQMSPASSGKEAIWRKKAENGSEWTQWKESLDYDVKARPWFVGALAHHHSRRGMPKSDTVSWTQPYEFATTHDPGITASAAIEGGDGEILILALDVLLNDLSKFALDVTRTQPGTVFLLDGPPGDPDARLIGVPFEQEAGKRGSLPLLQSPSAVGGPIDDFARIATEEHAAGLPTKFISEDEPWWGVVSRAQLDPDHAVYIAVLIPESDLRKGLPPVHLITILGTILMLLVAVFRARHLADTYTRPVDALVQRSRRMERLDFEPVAEPVRTNITEMRQLAATFESLRQALAGFTGQREDLRIAAAVHDSVASCDPVVVSPFAAAGATSRSAEVGGATVTLLARPDDAGLAALLLDLGGHGIETATALARLDSVFRGGLGAEVETERIAAELLAASSALGRPAKKRFWIARTDSGSNAVEVFSSGVAWLVLGRDGASSTWYCDEEPRVSKTTTPRRFEIELSPGDRVVAVSSAVLETTDAVGARWDRDGVEEALHEAADGSAAAVRDTLVAGLRKHHQGTPTDWSLLALTLRHD